MPQEIPATYDGCNKKFLIEHALSCPNGGLVLARHDDAAKEWGALGARALVPSAVTYEPKINSRTVQGERTGAGLPGHPTPLWRCHAAQEQGPPLGMIGRAQSRTSYRNHRR